jgi:hypothetical protein
MPEYVEEKNGSWAHYYDENGEFRQGIEKYNHAFKKSSEGSDLVAQKYMLAIIDEALLRTCGHMT